MAATTPLESRSSTSAQAHRQFLRSPARFSVELAGQSETELCDVWINVPKPKLEAFETTNRRKKITMHSVRKRSMRRAPAVAGVAFVVTGGGIALASIPGEMA